METVELRIITPPRASEYVGLGLVAITEALTTHDPDLDLGWRLGGPNGYGANFENDTFMMHRYCWCEREECLWCRGCGCDDGEVEWYVDDKQVTCDEQWTWNKE